MPQHQDLGFKPSSRLEAVTQHADEKEGAIVNIQQSCSDSLATPNPMDGVFGTDRQGLCLSAQSDRDKTFGRLKNADAANRRMSVPKCSI